MPITNGYCTLAEFRNLVGVNDGDDDEVLERLITSVSRLIDQVCHTRFYTASEIRYFTTEFPGWCAIDDCTGVTTLKTDEDGDGVYETTWLATDYVLEPANAALDGVPYEVIYPTPNGQYTFPKYRRGVQVTGTFGFSAAAPGPVKEACILQVNRLWKRKDSPFGIAGTGALGQVVTISKLDPDVMLLIDRAPYNRRLRQPGVY
jgi:hypothetical protein